MTSYRIEVGYNSNHPREEVGAYMLKGLDAICNDPLHIVDEALDFQPHLDREVLEEYCQSYRNPQDLTVMVRTDEETGLPTITQLSSGGGESREIKEALRRAACRLIMNHCHRNGMEVSVIVT